MFKDRINEYLVDNAYHDIDRNNARHWPSEASVIRDDGTVVGKCIREQYYIRKHYPVEERVAAHHVRKWHMGKAIEQNEIGYAKEIGIWIDDDVSFKLDLGDILISGKLDAIYEDEDGRRICVEYKTSEGYIFEREVYGKYRRLRGVPKPEHVLQVMLYLTAFPDLAYGDIFYINRGKLDVIEHIIEMDNGAAVINGEITDLTLDKIYERYRELTKYLDDDEVPPRDFCPQYSPDCDMEQLRSDGCITKKSYEAWLNDDILPGFWRCSSWCGFREQCIADDEGVEGRSGAIVNI